MFETHLKELNTLFLEAPNKIVWLDHLIVNDEAHTDTTSSIAKIRGDKAIREPYNQLKKAYLHFVG